MNQDNMIQKPKVSVIIPVYAVEQYIERCARSLFEQTLDSIEYLFINDCTPDKSIDILKRILEEYPHRKNQVVIHNMDVNSGQAAVRKWGILNASGEYIIHCDSDDWVDHNIYKELYDAAKKNNADVAVCDFYRAYGNDIRNAVVGCHSTKVSEFVNNLVRNKDIWALWNKLIKASCYQCINFPKSNMGEDMAYVLQIAYNIKKVAYVQKPLYYYFYNPLSITNNKTEEKILDKYTQIIDNVQLLLDFYSDKELSSDLCSYLNYLKWTQRDILLPIVCKKKYYKLWRSTFSGIEWVIMNDRKQKARDRLKCLLTILHIYPFFGLQNKE